MKKTLAIAVFAAGSYQFGVELAASASWQLISALATWYGEHHRLNSHLSHRLITSSAVHGRSFAQGNHFLLHPAVGIIIRCPHPNSARPLLPSTASVRRIADGALVGSYCGLHFLFIIPVTLLEPHRRCHRLSISDPEKAGKNSVRIYALDQRLFRRYLFTGASFKPPVGYLSHVHRLGAHLMLVAQAGLE